MGCDIRRREKAVNALWNFWGVKCAGLNLVRGPKCPVPEEFLTVKDIQIGHLQRNGLIRRAAWKHALLNPDHYLPLCVLCNYRMRELQDECRTYLKGVRREVAEYASKHGGIAAAKKYGVNHNTVLKWRAEFGLPKFTGAH